MRGLARNKSTFWYAQILGKRENTVDGQRTGSFKPEYGEHKKCSAFVRGDMSVARIEEFGINSRYDNSVSKSGFSRVIVVDTPNCPIDETCVLWIDNAKNHNTEPHDYVVKRVTKSFNSTVIGVARVNIR